MKKYLYNTGRNCVWALMILLSCCITTACSDNVTDEAYYTFTGNTVASYCATNPEYSTFARLLEETGNYALLSTYGHYTCFLPTDEAFKIYFNEKGTSYDRLTKEEKTQIVYDHVIKSLGIDFTSEYFEEGSLSETSMSDRYITISYDVAGGEGGLTIKVNKTTPILEKDIEVHNGVIHVVGRLVEPSEDFLLNVLEKSGKYEIFAEAFEMTGMNDSTELIYDESYVCPYPSGANGSRKIPLTRKYGYTLFAETDSLFHMHDIYSVEDLVKYAEQYYGTEAQGEYTNRNNALNKFVSYHLLDRQMSTNSFLYDGFCTAPNFMHRRVEYYETMLRYRLMEIKAGNQINTQKNGVHVGIIETESNLSAVNGFVHSLDAILVCDDEVMENDVLNKRIRFDFYNIPPALTNNNIRWKVLGRDLDPYEAYTITHDYCGEHLTFSEDTQITMWAEEGWTNFEADELKLNGWYDFTLRMLPLPPGSYEIRMGYRAESWRGIAQLFIDGEIAGIPRDLRLVGDDPQVGWVEDTGTPVDAENDKAMRNRGYMKAPASIFTRQFSDVLRTSKHSLRIIIGQYTWQEYGPHYFRGKNVYSPGMEFHGDFIEIIPTSLIDKEDIY